MADIDKLMKEKLERVKKGYQSCKNALCESCPYDYSKRPNDHYCDSGKMSDDAIKVIEYLEKKVEDQQERIAIMSEGGWHDAEKDPPKETDCYIVRIDYGIGQMTTMREYISSESKWLMSREEKITHWMPMPEPPKEGEQE